MDEKESNTEHTVPEEIDFPRYNMKCSGENVIQRRIFHVVSCFPLLLMLYAEIFITFRTVYTGNWVMSLSAVHWYRKYQTKSRPQRKISR